MSGPVDTYDVATIAFGQSARNHRRKFKIPIIAVGGSNGKTSTKDMLECVLSTQYRVLATPYNFNSEMGAAKTLLKLTSEHEIAVVEVGTRHFGDLKYLCEMVEPTHALLTNIGREHLEYFGDIEGVLKEESELFRYIEEHDGIAFVNNADLNVSRAGNIVRRKFTYGVGEWCQFVARHVSMDTQGLTVTVFDKTRNESNTVTVPLVGMHHIEMILAVVSVARTFEVSLENIRKGLSNYVLPNGRLNIARVNDYIIINDSYNSNPDSVRVALDLLDRIVSSGKKVIVFGDMLELGEKSISEHMEVAKQIRQMGITNVYTVGENSRCMNFMHFEDNEKLMEHLKTVVSREDVILVKGSRNMRMWTVIRGLM